MPSKACFPQVWSQRSWLTRVSGIAWRLPKLKCKTIDNDMIFFSDGVGEGVLLEVIASFFSCLQVEQYHAFSIMNCFMFQCLLDRLFYIGCARLMRSQLMVKSLRQFVTCRIEMWALWAQAVASR